MTSPARQSQYSIVVSWKHLIHGFNKPAKEGINQQTQTRTLLRFSSYDTLWPLRIWEVIYLSFRGKALRCSFFCLGINDRFQGPFLKLKHRVNTSYIKHRHLKCRNKCQQTQYYEHSLSPSACSAGLVTWLWFWGESPLLSSTPADGCASLLVLLQSDHSSALKEKRFAHLIIIIIMPDFMLITKAMGVATFSTRMSKCLILLPYVGEQLSSLNSLRSLTNMLVPTVLNMTGNYCSFTLSHQCRFHLSIITIYQLCSPLNLSI